MNKRLITPLIGLGPVLLVACSGPISQTPTNTTDNVGHDSMMMDEEMMDGEAMGMMMTHGLDAACNELTRLSLNEKRGMVAEIGHNMDANALDKLFQCIFRDGQIEHIGVVTEDDLKINPKDAEDLYYIPETEQFFVTCKSLSTIAYVVDGKNAGSTRREWNSYFQTHRSAFVDAAAMAKEMMHEMMEMGEDHAKHAYTSGAIQTYSPTAYAQALADGKTVVLDFHATWCPICAANAPKIKAAFENAGHANVVGFIADYDTETALENQFDVSSQSTLVKVRGSDPKSAAKVGSLGPGPLTQEQVATFIQS